MKIDIKPIDRILMVDDLADREDIAIIFISTDRPDYYDFGSTKFYWLHLSDKKITEIDRKTARLFEIFVDKLDGLDKVYIGCDAGISRSPAIGLFIAQYYNLDDEYKRIRKHYPHYNKSILNTLTKEINLGG